MADPKAPTVEELQEKLAAAEKALADQKAAAEKALAGAKYVVPKGFKRVDYSDDSYTYVSSEKIIVINADKEEVETTIAEIFRGKEARAKKNKPMGRYVVKVEK